MTFGSTTLLILVVEKRSRPDSLFEKDILDYYFYRYSVRLIWITVQIDLVQKESSRHEEMFL
jgi:hypothetical protein